MFVLRARLIGVLLALVMVLTSAAMASARAAPGPSGMIELCTGTGPVMVAVDDQGQPVGHPHLCPDHAAHAFDIGAALALPPAPPRLARLLRFAPAQIHAAPQSRPCPQARGPPFSV